MLDLDLIIFLINWNWTLDGLLDLLYLHDIPHNDTVDEFWGHTPCCQGSPGSMLSHIGGTVVLQHATIRTERSALGRYDKYT